MKARHCMLAAHVAIIFVPVVAFAQSVEEKNLLSGKAVVDPAAGYMFIQSAYRTQGMFLRVPDDSTRQAYMQDWEEAFEKAKKKHQSALKSWGGAVAIAKKTKKSLPEEPIEPTRESYSIGPIEMLDTVSFGPMFVFSKTETQYNYLTKVKPGTYVYYGPVFYGANGAMSGLCYCMGTVKFEVKPGVITDLGNFLAAAPKAAPPFDVNAQMVIKMNEERAVKGKDPILPVPSQIAYGMPESLKSHTSAQAEFHASGKLNNYYKILVTRIAPIPGVLGYRRDTVIDLRNGHDVPNPPIETQVKIKK